MFECINCRCGQYSTVYGNLPDRYLGHPGRFSYVACGGCGLVQLLQVPADLGQYYRGFPQHHQDSPVYRILRRLLVGHCYPMPRGKAGSLLDVGSGNGWYLQALARRGWEVCGYEFDADYARRMSAELGVEVIAGVDSLAERAGQFDVVTFNFSFEHLTEPRRFLRLAHAKTAPGGRVYLSLPDPESTEARFFGREWFAWDVPRHVCFFTRQQIGELLTEAGFRDVRVRNLPVPTVFAGSLCYRLLGRLHRRLWRAAIVPGILWSLFVPDGLFAVWARKA